MVKFCEQFLRNNQSLEYVYYFSAAQIDRGKKERQDLFFSANRLNPKFKLVLGKYIKKDIQTRAGVHHTYEEKQTDVNIAVQMIRNVVLAKNDISILISADSDLIPPIDFIRELNPNHKIYCYFPPNRYSIDLQNNSDGIYKLAHYGPRFKKAMLPDEVHLPSGYILKRPQKWN